MIVHLTTGRSLTYPRARYSIRVGGWIHLADANCKWVASYVEAGVQKVDSFSDFFNTYFF